MGQDSRRHVCIHGHFYQPPRENPWLDVVEVEDSAAPFHDWNERIDAECYAANAAARVQSPDGRVTAITNNYERISFNFGPTLLAWMEAAAPETFEALREADRLSALRLGGHGNAIAQVYNHIIMPLASARDRATQVRWGVADFRKRFGREPEGMWLAETAADTPTLEALAAEGMRFTILAPSQAAATAPGDRDEWTDVGDGAVDPTRPYRCDLPSGRSIAIFFYDGPIAQAVAFGGLLADGREFARRLAAALPSDPGDGEPRLAHVAADGETYGHHHRFGDMALAAALRALTDDHGARITNYARFLEVCPPRTRVRIHEGSSWSCAHGVERWRSDCGCHTGRGAGQGWNQKWRAPLREALDALKERLDGVFERAVGGLLDDPWAARDDYVHVVLDRSRESVDRFLDRHRAGPLDNEAVVRVLRSLEMQRAGMLMFTSCGWFFDDIGGLESVQVLRYACRAAHLARDVSGEDLEGPLVASLERARSNVPSLGDGGEIYRRLVLPLAVDLRRVAAHHAIAGVFDDAGPGGTAVVDSSTRAYDVRRLDWFERESSGTRLAVGRVEVASLATRETQEALLALIHFGGHDFRCAVASPVSGAAYEAVRDELDDKYVRHSLSDVVTAMQRRFGDDGMFSLRDTFLEDRRRILRKIVERTLDDLESQYVRFYRDHGRLLSYLADSNVPFPDAFRIAVEFALPREIERLAAALAAPGVDPASPALAEVLIELRGLLEQAASWGIRLPAERLRGPMTRALLARIREMRSCVDAPRLDAIHALVDIIEQYGVAIDLWRVQNAAFRILSEPGWSARIETADADSRANVERAVLRLADRLRFDLDRLSRV